MLISTEDIGACLRLLCSAPERGFTSGISIDLLKEFTAGIHICT